MPVPEENDDSAPKELNFQKDDVDETLMHKAKLIELAFESKDDNKIEVLRKFALSKGGLVNDEIRCKVWPALLGLDPANVEMCVDRAELEQHPEYHQVVLDVKRSLKRFPPGIPYEQRVALQDQLTHLILRVIIKYPHLRYYQGYHDVAVTFLLVVGENVAFQIMERLSTDNLRECMEPTMDKTSYLLNYIYPLINRLHPTLFEFLERSGVGTIFCLPWYLTWYGHSLNHYKDVVRLYDYFLASPPLLPLYLAATIVVHRSDEIFCVDCDMANVHCLLSQLPDDLPFESLLAQASELYEKFPPNSIESEVKERHDRELPRKKVISKRGRRGRFWPYFFPDWAMRNRGVRFLVATATIAVGLYAYYRYDGPELAFLPSSVR